MNELVNLAGSLTPAGLLSMPESSELRVPVKLDSPDRVRTTKRGNPVE
jgi:hypothetical protein